MHSTVTVHTLQRTQQVHTLLRYSTHTHIKIYTTTHTNHNMRHSTRSATVHKQYNTQYRTLKLYHAVQYTTLELALQHTPYNMRYSTLSPQHKVQHITLQNALQHTIQNNTLQALSHITVCHSLTTNTYFTSLALIRPRNHICCSLCVCNFCILQRVRRSTMLVPL